MFGILGFNLLEGSGVPGFRLGLRILGFNFLGWVWDFSVQTYLVFFGFSGFSLFRIQPFLGNFRIQTFLGGWDFLDSEYLGLGMLEASN